MADHLASNFPAILFRTHRTRISTSTELAGIVEGSAFVAAAANSPSANVVAGLVSNACLPLDIPHSVGAGYSHDLGTAGVTVVPGKSPCWMCLQHQLQDPVFAAKRVIRPADTPVGMVPMVAAILGNLVAWDAFRVIVGAEPVLAGRVVELSLSSLGFSFRPFGAAPDCLCPFARARSGPDHKVDPRHA